MQTPSLRCSQIEDSVSDGLVAVQNPGVYFPQSTSPLRHTNTVPRFVFVLFFIVILIQGFVYNSIFWLVVPSFVDFMNVSEETATVPAQIFLLVECLASIFGGLLTDLKCTRYRLIFVSHVMLLLSYACLMLLEYFINYIHLQYRVYPYAIFLFITAASLGTSWGALIPFGIEQLNDDSDHIKRSSLIRWVIFLYQVGLCFSYPMMYYEDRLGLIVRIIILGSVAFMIFMIVICKRYYVYNTQEGKAILKQFKTSIRRCLNLEEEEEEFHFLLEPPPPVTDELIRYQLSLFRRYIFLLLIFTTFGAYSNVYFMSNMVYPIQARQMMNKTTAGVEFTVDYDYRASLVILIVAVVLDILYRNSACWRSTVSNFVLVGIGLVFAALSIGTAALSHYLYGQKGKLINLPNQHLEKDLLISLEYVFLGFCKIFFLSGGFDMAYKESPKTLRGTFIGLFLGVGSVFGCCMFFLQYSIHPSGVNHMTWPYVMVFGIIFVTTLVMYLPLVKIYIRRRSEFRQLRQTLNEEYRDISLDYGTNLRGFLDSEESAGTDT